ncbi:MAG: hypothetical protein B6245_20435 [Desulfobacteraceae bacterium 4572_88]|nr:MAG: hypothetical protein B6245_20435 [Desulfobacteraceae bacterium 4572_88]
MELGLASAYGIIRNHDGAIDVHSEKGEGTTFSIYLPASEEEDVPEYPRQSEEVLKGSGTILLADDEDIILDVGREMIQMLGYEVIIAASGEEAVGICQQHQEEIDLVILDMITVRQPIASFERSALISVFLFPADMAWMMPWLKCWIRAARAFCKSLSAWRLCPGKSERFWQRDRPSDLPATVKIPIC